MLFALLIAHPTMAPRKHLPKTAEAARNDGCNLVTDFFKKNSAGRPKKRGNSANDDVQAQPAISNKKKKRGPIPNHKKDAPPAQMMKIAKPAGGAAVATLDAPTQKTKKARTNWGKGEAKLQLEKAYYGLRRGIGELGFWTSQSW
jgi:hypothetical protein